MVHISILRGFWTSSCATRANILMHKAVTPRALQDKEQHKDKDKGTVFVGAAVADTGKLKRTAVDDGAFEDHNDVLSDTPAADHLAIAARHILCVRGGRGGEGTLVLVPLQRSTRRCSNFCRCNMRKTISDLTDMVSPDIF